VIALKIGVRLFGLRPEMVLAAQVVNAVYETSGDLQCIITSASDGTHRAGSLHYVGAALDFRLPAGSALGVVAQIKQRLGEDFDVVLESDHVHIEWQPKQPY